VQFRDDRLEAHRVFADRQRSEVIDGSFQAAGHRSAVEGHGKSFNAVIRADLHDHNRPRCIRVFWGICERVRFREDQDLRAGVRYLHWPPSDASLLRFPGYTPWMMCRSLGLTRRLWVGPDFPAQMKMPQSLVEPIAIRFGLAIPRYNACGFLAAISLKQVLLRVQ
jgi:hypothetical protein